jgi:hypothetical protein
VVGPNFLKKLERAKGFEPSTPILADCASVTQKEEAADLGVLVLASGILILALAVFVIRFASNRFPALTDGEIARGEIARGEIGDD